MTHEEAKKMGATHYTKCWLYFKVVVCMGVMKKYILRDGEFIYCGKWYTLKPI